MKTIDKKTKQILNPGLLFFKRFKQLGHTEEETEAIVNYVEQSREFDLAQLVTKDFLKSELIEMKADILQTVDQRFDKFEERFDKFEERFDKFEERFATKDLLKAEISSLKDEMRKWTVGVILALIGIAISIWFK